MTTTHNAFSETKPTLIDPKRELLNCLSFDGNGLLQVRLSELKNESGYFYTGDDPKDFMLKNKDKNVFYTYTRRHDNKAITLFSAGKVTGVEEFSDSIDFYPFDDSYDYIWTKSQIHKISIPKKNNPFVFNEEDDLERKTTISKEDQDSRNAVLAAAFGFTGDLNYDPRENYKFSIQPAWYTKIIALINAYNTQTHNEEWKKHISSLNALRFFLLISRSEEEFDFYLQGWKILPNLSKSIWTEINSFMMNIKLRSNNTKIKEEEQKPEQKPSASPSLPEDLVPPSSQETPSSKSWFGWGLGGAVLGLAVAFVTSLILFGLPTITLLLSVFGKYALIGIGSGILVGGVSKVIYNNLTKPIKPSNNDATVPSAGNNDKSNDDKVSANSPANTLNSTSFVITVVNGNKPPEVDSRAPQALPPATANPVVNSNNDSSTQSNATDSSHLPSTPNGEESPPPSPETDSLLVEVDLTDRAPLPVPSK